MNMAFNNIKLLDSCQHVIKHHLQRTPRVVKSILWCSVVYNILVLMHVSQHVLSTPYGAIALNLKN